MKRRAAPRPSGRWIDISTPITLGARRYPGDPRVSISLAADPAQGDPARVTKLSMGVHTGTHVDAPNHLPGLRGSPGPPGGVDSLPLDAMLGPAVVIQAPRRRPLAPRDLGPLVRSGRRVLFRGSPVILEETALELVRRGVILVGTDGLSIDPVESPGDGALPAHRALLRSGVVILEGLRLAGVPPGRYWMAALPLLIPGSDGAPARAVLRAPYRPMK